MSSGCHVIPSSCHLISTGREESPRCGVDGAAIMAMESTETTLSEVRARLSASGGQAFVRLVGDAELQKGPVTS